MANFKKIDEVLKYIKDYPENHDQQSWVEGSIDGPLQVRASNGEHPPCGTTMCFAGWTSFLFAPENHFLGSSCIYDRYNNFFDSVPEFASMELDLTDNERNTLFHRCKTYGELCAVVDYMKYRSTDGQKITYQEFSAVIFGYRSYETQDN